MPENNSEKEKRICINIRIDKETKDNFMNICKSKAINSSELIRQWIQKFIKDNQCH